MGADPEGRSEGRGCFPGHSERHKRSDGQSETGSHLLGREPRVPDIPQPKETKSRLPSWTAGSWGSWPPFGWWAQLLGLCDPEERGVLCKQPRLPSRHPKLGPVGTCQASKPWSLPLMSADTSAPGRLVRQNQHIMGEKGAQGVST